MSFSDAKLNPEGLWHFRSYISSAYTSSLANRHPGSTAPWKRVPFVTCVRRSCHIWTCESNNYFHTRNPLERTRHNATRAPYVDLQYLQFFIRLPSPVSTAKYSTKFLEAFNNDVERKLLVSQIVNAVFSQFTKWCLCLCNLCRKIIPNGNISTL